MTVATRQSFLLENFDRFPRSVGLHLFVFQRALEIHLREKIVGIEFQETRKKDFRVGKIASSKFLQRLFICFEPFQKLWIRFVASAGDKSKNIYRFGFALHLHASN